MKYYAEYGALGVVVALFIYGYVKQGKVADKQAEALDRLDIENKGQSVKINELSDVMMEVKGSVSRINGK